MFKKIACKTFECDEKIYKNNFCLAHYGATLIVDIVQFELTHRKIINQLPTEEDFKIIEDLSKDYLKRHNYFWNEYITEQIRFGHFSKPEFIDC